MKPYGMRFLKEYALRGSAYSCIYGYGGIRRRRGCRRTRRRKAGEPCHTDQSNKDSPSRGVLKDSL